VVIDLLRFFLWWLLMVEAFRFILPGLGITVSVTLIALGLGLALGIVTGMSRAYGGKVLRSIAGAYSILVRSLPVVVIIFILFFVIAELVDLSPFFSGAIALGVASGAYQCEIFRGAINAVPHSQMVAARAIGMSRFKAATTIILPQAVRLALPAWANEVTLVLKDSSLVYVIGVPEIMRRAQYVSATTMEPFAAFGAAALMYLVLTLLASRLLEKIETRMRLDT
jgi:polar amino acid transport system permease protein